MNKIRIAVADWRYDPWRKDFYPNGLRQEDEWVTEPEVEPQEPL
ncbi:hypothetical protein RTH46_23675 [Pseudomonas sp. zfem004]|nr:MULTISPECIES: hypothetical protein [unclassified Pseudomonas]MDU9405489.1 hypothetical protein [Pseudomonas sp. zfem004]